MLSRNQFLKEVNISPLEEKKKNAEEVIASTKILPGVNMLQWNMNSHCFLIYFFPPEQGTKDHYYPKSKILVRFSLDEPNKVDNPAFIMSFELC